MKVSWPSAHDSVQFSSIQSLTCVWFFVTPGLQHTRPPCPSPTLGTCSNSCPLTRWCHPTIISSVVPFSCLESFPASGSFQMSQLFTWGGQNIGVSASTSVLPMNIQDCRMDRLDLLAVQGTLKSPLQHHRSKVSILWHLSFLYGPVLIHTWQLEKPKLWLDGPLLAK